MTDPTAELRAAHDVLAPLYAERLADAIDRSPVDRAVLGLFAELVREHRPGATVGDIGCGTGRLAPYLARLGLTTRGVDLSPGMIDLARRDHPAVEFRVGDVRALPFADGELAGVVCWYSLMFLPPGDRPGAFAELARVVEPGGHLVTAFKAGAGELRRAGRSTGLGVEFDLYYLAPDEVVSRVEAAGFEQVFWAGRPAQGTETGPQGFLVARRR